MTENSTTPIERKEIPVEYEIAAVFAEHIGEVREQMVSNRDQRLKHHGIIHELDLEYNQMQKHLGVLLGLIERNDHLPASVVPYALSQDGKKMLGKVTVKGESL